MEKLPTEEEEYHENKRQKLSIWLSHLLRLSRRDDCTGRGKRSLISIKEEVVECLTEGSVKCYRGVK